MNKGPNLKMKIRWLDPEYRKRVGRAISKGLRRRFREDPEYKEKISENTKKQWEDSKFRELMRKVSVENGKKTGAKNGRKAFNRLWKDSEFRKKVLAVTPENLSVGMLKKWQDSKYRKEMSKKGKEQMIKNWEDGTISLDIIGQNPSRPHMSFFRSICRRGVKGYKLHHRVGRKTIDLANPRKMIAVEIDGRYWHRDKLARRRRDSYLKHRGWTVIHISTDEIWDFDIGVL